MSNQLIPANGWCYSHFDNARDSVAIYDVTLWEVLEDGSVIGLISVEFPGASEARSPHTSGTPRLVAPPPACGGKYFLNGSTDDPRQWPTPPKIVACWPDRYSVTGE